MRELLRRIYYFLNRNRLQHELEQDMAAIVKCSARTAQSIW
jgi:hypothetical protein